jgi:electron transfer flavoprotein alpha subunit
MKEYKTIIPINKNPKETIFFNADFGIVGHYNDIIPEFIVKVKTGFVFGLDKK